MSEIKLGLVKGRHDIKEVDDYIFDEIKDVFDFESMRKEIANKLEHAESLRLYVTGLTAVLVEVIGYCVLNGVHLTLMHYNKETDKYVSQEMTATHTELDNFLKFFNHFVERWSSWSKGEYISKEEYNYLMFLSDKLAEFNIIEKEIRIV